ncbi:MAG: nucleotidyltransferase domain-containing protein [Pseudomonadota bacterium]
MLLDELRQKKSAIDEILHKYGASRIRVFGSVSRKCERPDSDIDFLVDFPRGYDLFRQRLPMQEALELLFSRRVDLIPEHELNLHLRSSIFNEAIEL